MFGLSILCSSSSLGTATVCEFWPTQQFSSCFSIHSHLTPIRNLHFPTPVVTSSSHRHLALPILLTAGDLHSVFLFTILSLSILAICPIHLILFAFIHPTSSTCWISKSGYSLVLILQLPCWSGLLLSFQTWVYYTSYYTNFVSFKKPQN